MQNIIVNSRVHVEEETSYDNWGGGISGHSLYFKVPEDIYLDVLSDRTVIQEQITKDINSIHNIQNEFIENSFLEMEVEKNTTDNWRTESTLRMAGKRTIKPKAADRIWEKGKYRIFLSHKADVKKETALLKDKLSIYGVSCFVAHEDITPTQEWQEEIENGLFTMDALIALMTDNFHDSDWTDQEVGVAIGRDVPIISVKLGKAPYGFIGKFQALSCSWNEAPKNIIKILINHEKMRNAYINAVHDCLSYENANNLAEVLPFINELSEIQIDRLIKAYNENGEIHDAFGFNGTNRYYEGLVFHLNRLTEKTYYKTKRNKIEVET